MRGWCVTLSCFALLEGCMATPEDLADEQADGVELGESEQALDTKWGDTIKWPILFPETFYHWPESEPLDPDVIRCGDAIALKHTNTTRWLGLGGGGSTMGTREANYSTATHWTVRGIHHGDGDENLGCVAGQPIAPGDTIRLGLDPDYTIHVIWGMPSPVTGQVLCQQRTVGYNHADEFVVEYVSGAGGLDKYLRLGGTIRLINTNTNAALHSHKVLLSPESPAYEVTGYAGRDSNDYWTIADRLASTAQVEAASIKTGELMRIRHEATRQFLTGSPYHYYHPGTSGQSLVFAGEPAREGLWFAKSTWFTYRFENYMFENNLHSHPGPRSPVTGQGETTLWGVNGVGDTNDDWYPDIPSYEPWLWWRSLRVMHYNTYAALHSHNAWFAPEPGSSSKVQEVTTYQGRDGNDMWTVRLPENTAGLKLRSIFTGRNLSCGVGLTDDQVYCWGANEAGQLVLDRGVPGLGFAVPIAGLHDIVEIAPGSQPLARASDETVYAWGNGKGPVPVNLPKNVISIASDGEQFAVTADGKIYRWQQDRTVPTLVSGSELAWIESHVGTVQRVHSGGGCFTGTNAGHVACRNSYEPQNNFSLLDQLFDPSYGQDLEVAMYATGLCAFAPHAPVGSQVFCWLGDYHGVPPARTVELAPPGAPAPAVAALTGVAGNWLSSFALADGRVIRSSGCWDNWASLCELAQPAPLVKFATAGLAEHGCGLDAQGMAYCWGGNKLGAVGNGRFGRTPNRNRAYLVQPLP